LRVGEARGGRVLAESGLGRGAIFRIGLPLLEASAPPLDDRA